MTSGDFPLLEVRAALHCPVRPLFWRLEGGGVLRVSLGGGSGPSVYLPTILPHVAGLGARRITN